MAVRVELTVEDQTYYVRRYHASILRDEDEKGRPKSDPTWRLHVLIDSVDDQEITNWMLDPKKKIDGKLTVFKLGEDSKMKEITFRESSCFKLWDYFNADYSHTCSFLSISGKDFNINTAELKQNWPG